MKYGIITHYDVHNHGAHLQMYALIQVLKELGYDAKALRYAKTCNSILLLDDSVSKDTVKELIEDGYKVLRKNFTVQLLESRQLNTVTRYNIVCTDAEKALDYFVRNFSLWIGTGCLPKKNSFRLTVRR